MKLEKDITDNVGFDPLENGNRGTGPNINNQSILHEHFGLLVSEYKNSSLCDKKHAARTFVKGIAILLGGVSGIPYMTTARAYARDNQILGHLYVYSNVASVGVLTSWLFLEILASRERVVASQKSRACIKNLAPAVLASLGAIPYGIVGFIYNSKHPYFSIIAFSTNMVNSTFALSRLFNSIAHYVSTKFSSNQKLAIEQTRKLFITRLQLARRGLMSQNISERSESLLHFCDREGDPDLSDFISELLNIGSAIHIKRQRHLLSGWAIGTNALLWSAAIAAPLGWSITGCKLVYEETLSQTKSTMVAGLIAALSTVPVYLLDLLVVRDLFSKGFSVFADLFSRQHIPDFPQKHHPKLLFTLSLLGLATTAFSYGPVAFVIQDQYKAHRTYSAIASRWAASTWVMVTSYAMLTSISEIMTFFSSIITGVEKNYMAKFSRFSEDLIASINESSLKDFSKFLKRINVDALIADNPNDHDLIATLSALQENQRINHSDANQNDYDSVHEKTSSPLLFGFNADKKVPPKTTGAPAPSRWQSCAVL